MDKKTIAVYDAGADHYTNDWLSQPTDSELHRLVSQFFEAGAATADIGSGSGRDTAWLNENGFPCVGFDASEGLLRKARERFPQYSFSLATLPELREIETARFRNVLCETVLQHLPVSEHLGSLENLLRITAPGGTLSMSFRHPRQSESDRETDERLYVSVDTDQLIRRAKELGALAVHQKTLISPSSGKKISQLVLQKK